jgi:SET domain-containing protein
MCIRCVNSGIAEQCNVCFANIVVDGRMHIMVQAVRPIEVDEELLLDYGPLYWGSDDEESDVDDKDDEEFKG